MFHPSNRIQAQHQQYLNIARRRGQPTSDALLDVYDLPLDLMDADDRVGASLGQPHLTLGGGETLQVGRVVAAEEAATVDRSVRKMQNER